MSRAKTPQSMKPATAAKKLGIYLPAAPPEIQERDLTRDEFDALQAEPPEWLRELRANGPHPRPVVAARLGISIAGLGRNDLLEPLTTEQIRAIIDEAPAWLFAERATYAEVRREEKRIKERDDARRAQGDGPGHHAAHGRPSSVPSPADTPAEPAGPATENAGPATENAGPVAEAAGPEA